jgi:hypothetical protein
MVTNSVHLARTLGERTYPSIPVTTTAAVCEANLRELYRFAANVRRSAAIAWKIQPGSARYQGRMRREFSFGRQMTTKARLWG